MELIFKKIFSWVLAFEKQMSIMQKPKQMASKALTAWAILGRQTNQRRILEKMEQESIYVKLFIILHHNFI